MKRSKLLMVIVATLIATGSTGCTSQRVQYQILPLPLPERPLLPAISADELQCLSDETYSKLAERNRLRRQYAEQLETIITSTHGQH